MKFKESAFFRFFSKFGKYHFTILIFLFVIVYWDENNLIYRFTLDRKIHQLESDIEHYEGIIKESTKQLDQLRTNSEKLEKFARENYLMKKKDEDIFIVEEETEAK
jgi:cell division protein DivIC